MFLKEFAKAKHGFGNDLGTFKGKSKGEAAEKLLPLCRFYSPSDLLSIPTTSGPSWRMNLA